MQTIDLFLVIGAGLVLILGAISSLIKQTIFSEPLLATAAGIVLGPVALGILTLPELEVSHPIIEQIARITLAISVMGVALRVPPSYFRRRWRGALLLLAVAMLVMWFSASLLTFIVLSLSFSTAMLIGAALTPTDPVLASSIVTGRVAQENLPDELRNTISTESGANDGLALPFVLLPIILLIHQPDEALRHWLVHAVLWSMGGAVVVGAVLGYLAARLMEWAEARHVSDSTSLLAYTLALSLVSLGLISLLGSDGVLGVFATGVAFTLSITESERLEEERVQEAINRFFTLPIFVLFGIALPWADWIALGWRGAALAAAIIFLRRLPVFLGLSRFLDPVRGLPRGLFAGWFGPIGVAALYYATFAERSTGLAEVWVVVSLVAAASIAVHGATATPFVHAFARLSRSRR